MSPQTRVFVNNSAANVNLRIFSKKIAVVFLLRILGPAEKQDFSTVGTGADAHGSWTQGLESNAQSIRAPSSRSILTTLAS